MLDLPWSEEYMNRCAYPLYDEFCRSEDEAGED